MKLRLLTDTWAKVQPHAQSTVLLLIRVSMGWGFFLTGKGKLVNLERTTRFISILLAFTMIVAYLTAHREGAFLSLSDFTDQAPFPFLMAALVTSAFGAEKFSIDRLLQPWFDRITGNSRLSS